MTSLSEDKWHEFDWGKAPKMPTGPHKKLKIYADANIPRPLVEELRAVGIPIEAAAETGQSNLPDEDILQRAKKKHRVLLTMDRDFWKDRKHPLQKVRGIIFVDIAPDQIGKSIDGLARFYWLFAQYYPLDWWESMKARVTEYGFIIRFNTWKGKILEEEFKLMDDAKLLTRTLR
jgi:predicted nuclease of predicted toxin-antitoxin system